MSHRTLLSCSARNPSLDNNVHPSFDQRKQCLYQRVNRPANNILGTGNISDTTYSECRSLSSPAKRGRYSGNHNKRSQSSRHGDSSIQLLHFQDRSSADLNQSHDPNFDLSNSRPCFPSPTTPSFQSPFSQFLQCDDWPESLSTSAPTPDCWAPLPTHDATIHGLDLFDLPPALGSLFPEHVSIPSTDLINEHNQYDTQTQPNDLSFTGSPYETHSLDSSLKGVCAKKPIWLSLIVSEYRLLSSRPGLFFCYRQLIRSSIINSKSTTLPHLGYC